MKNLGCLMVCFGVWTLPCELLHLLSGPHSCLLVPFHCMFCKIDVFEKDRCWERCWRRFGSALVAGAD